MQRDCSKPTRTMERLKHSKIFYRHLKQSIRNIYKKTNTTHCKTFQKYKTQYNHYKYSHLGVGRNPPLSIGNSSDCARLANAEHTWCKIPRKIGQGKASYRESLPQAKQRSAEKAPIAAFTTLEAAQKVARLQALCKKLLQIAATSKTTTLKHPHVPHALLGKSEQAFEWKCVYLTLIAQHWTLRPAIFAITLYYIRKGNNSLNT